MIMSCSTVGDERRMHTIETIEVNGNPMEVFLFRPVGDGPFPGILLAMHIPGHSGIENDEFTLRTAERLARNGYMTAVPFIFHWWPKGDEMGGKRDGFRDDWAVADLTAALELLRGRDDTNSEQVGIVGHCWGGRVAWLGACHLPGLKAAAIFYGGRIKTAMGEGNPPAIDLVANISCPVIGFFGNDDKFPTPEDVDDYQAALDRAGVPYSFHRYDGAGHAFQSFNSADHYREAQSEDAWEKLLVFLHEKLK